MDDFSESSRVVAVLMDDFGDFRMYSSMDLLAYCTSRSTIKLGSITVSMSAFSDFVLNNERLNGTSKGSSSKNNHSSGHESALTNGI